MNLLLIEREELDANNHVVLTGRRADHLRDVLEVGIGQELKAGVVHGPFATATVVAVGREIELRVELRQSCPVPDVELILALPRPKALSRVVQAASSFGVRRIDIINSWRVDASYFSSHKISPETLALDARLGCEQGKTTHVPEVQVHRYFVPFVEEVLRPRCTVDSTRRLLVAHPTATAPIESTLAHGESQPVSVAIGPDGGFLEREIETLVRLGATAVSFGQPVLRSEVAVVAILSQLDLLRRLAPARENRR